MNGEKTKSPGKEFSAQVSDYIPKRKNRLWDSNIDVVSPDIQQSPEAEFVDSESELSKKQKRPWHFSDSFSENTPPNPPEETGHKPDTKSSQTGNKPDTKLSTNRTQTGHKLNGRSLNKPKTGHKPDTEPDTVSDTNRAQTGNKPDTKIGFTHLVGLQRKVLLFVYRSCQSARSRTTEALSLEHISKSLGIRVGSVKTTIRRLEEKNCLFRNEFKNGRGGWSKYELPDFIFAALLQLETEHKLDTNWVQSEHKLDTEPDTQPDTSLSSSSSKDLYINKLTTTELVQSSELPSTWSEIDITPLSNIQFGKTHLHQLYRAGKLSLEEVQESICAFAFDLEVNEKNKTINGSLLNFFMGILRKGPYAPPVNYEAPEVRQMRLYLEAKERDQKARLELETRIENIEFDEWVENLTDEEKILFVPVTDFAKLGSQGHNVQLKQYFRENVWSKNRGRIIGTNIRYEIEESKLT